MNSRTARRLATIRLAHAARQLCAEIGSTSADGLSCADRFRMVNAFNALAYELDVRTGVVPRGSRPEPVDPAQEELFTLNRESGGDGNEFLG